jgi:hypothetical protein
LRARLISAELCAAAALASAVLLVSPGEMSKAYALVIIATAVLPGLMLTGEVKLINAGIVQPTQTLRTKTVASAALNFPIGVLALAFQDSRETPVVLLMFVLLGTLGATAQAFSSTWYYVQPDKAMVIRSKLLSASIKIICASVAWWRSELTWALIGMTLGAISEFTINFRSLSWKRDRNDHRRSGVLSPLGVAYGLARIVSAVIKVALSTLFGPLIASFIVIEQLVGGVNSIFEKYFVRSIQWRSTIRLSKVVYLLGMIMFIPWLYSRSLLPSDRWSLLWLTIVACAGLLPLSEMYTALERRGESYVAIGSAVICSCCAAAIAGAWLLGILGQASLFFYVSLPGSTFLFYWIAASHARNHTQL